MNKYNIDSEYQSNIYNCFQVFDQQMTMRMNKAFECIQQFDKEIILFSVINKPFPQFPFNNIRSKRDAMVEKFKKTMNRWIDQKIKSGHDVMKKCLTKRGLKTQADQQYDEEGEFVLECFVAMNKYIDDICQNYTILMIKNGDNRLLISFFILRNTLIMLKRTNKQNNHSSNHPIFRRKALIKCGNLHKELDSRMSYLNLSLYEWVENHVKLSKKNRKRAVNCKEFFPNLIEWLEIEYFKLYFKIIKPNPLRLTNILPFNDGQKCDIIICNKLTKYGKYNNISIEIEREINNDLDRLLTYFTAKQCQQIEEKSNNGEYETINDNINNTFNSTPISFATYSDSYSIISCNNNHDINHCLNCKQLQNENEKLKQEMEILKNKISEIARDHHQQYQIVKNFTNQILNVIANTNNTNQSRQFQSMSVYNGSIQQQIYQERFNQTRNERRNNVDLNIRHINYNYDYNNNNNNYHIQ